DAAQPCEFALQRTYPNPFNGQLRIDFSLEMAGKASLVVYDLSGRQVTEIANGSFTAGFHSVAWQADNLPSGMYALKLKSAGQTKTIKTILIR
ncbi:T9SS type A sorting domain-containing protein, partial [bacterium]|nr:T9SS type A sorting domain-containing protein [bacterium]